VSLFICFCINLISFLRQPLSFHILILVYLRITYLLTYLLTYLPTYLLTYSMEQSPSGEANWFSASQEIPSILWNLKIHYHIHKCLSPSLILSQIDPVHAPTAHFLKIHLKIILPSMPGSSKWSLSLRFPHQNPVYTSPLPYMCHMPISFIIPHLLLIYICCL